MEINFNMLGLFDKNGMELSVNEVMDIVFATTCNRVEVIDKDGRKYVNWHENNKVKILVQDDRSTLKIFISQN